MLQETSLSHSRQRDHPAPLVPWRRWAERCCDFFFGRYVDFWLKNHAMPESIEAILLFTPR